MFLFVIKVLFCLSVYLYISQVGPIFEFEFGQLLVVNCTALEAKLIRDCQHSPVDSPIDTIHQPRNVVSYELF